MTEYINEKAGYSDEKSDAVTVDFVPWQPSTRTYIDGHTLQAVTVEKAWGVYKLNDGNTIPAIAYGTWTLGNGDNAIGQVEQALDTGFDHVDTAQSYGNEEEAGKAIAASGLKREEIYITTKFSGRDNLSIAESIQGSLKKLNVDFVDLYLIHHPRLAQPDIATAWAEMEKIKAAGLAKSIGVSNFGVTELTTLLASAKVKPAANQILLHPYVHASQAPTLALCAANGIIVEAYSALNPITREPGGALDKPLAEISAKLNAKPEQVLLAWVKAKGALAVTTSSKKDRLQDYLAAASLPLSTADVAKLDAAGAVGYRSRARRVARVATYALFGAGIYGALQLLKPVLGGCT